jgi:delta endotoxin, N-terminal domain
MTDSASYRAEHRSPAPSSARPVGASAGYSIDPNEAAKDATAAALGAIPEVGELLSLLVEIFWPSGASDSQIWDSMEARVEALVNQKIQESVYEQAQADLEGLQKVLQDYAQAAKDGDTPSFISDSWVAARSHFDRSIPNFRVTGSEVLLLPLWAQAANMHLTLMRDGWLFGKDWGWNDATRNTVLKDLQGLILDYTAWAPRTFGRGISSRFGTVNYHLCEPFRTSNDFHQQMVPAVLDLAQRWPLFDPTVYPPPIAPDKAYLTSEVYSTPWGTADDSGLFVLPWQHPTQPPTQIIVWAEANLIDAIQVSYPAGAGPDGVSQTARMGAQNAGVPTTIKITPENPITTVDVWAGNVVQGLQFTFKDSTKTSHFGSSEGTHATFDFYQHDPSGRILSSIYVNGLSRYYNCIDAIVFGFRYEPRP